MTKINVGLRLEPETIAALEELAALMTACAGGVEVTPTAAARAALVRGIAVLRTELGANPLVQKGGKRPARKPTK
jgi:hypothetical protein